MRHLDRAYYEDLTEKLNDFLDEDKYDISYEMANAIEAAARIVNRHTPRTAGDYEIKQAIHIGDKEVVFGINSTPTEETPAYLVSHATTFHELGVAQFSDSMVSNDYLEIMKLFTERVNEQIKAVEHEREQLDIPVEPFLLDSVVKDSHLADYTGKLMVVRAEVLRPEYANMAHQLVLAESGNGCSPDARGSGVFTTTLATGKHQRFERRDFLGELRPELIPEWAKAAAKKYRLKRQAGARGLRTNKVER
ncbi:hypothetical protein LJC64_01170 [Ruminococcaceae bacterium OttesenSCG-928-A11]|nr:hypothetical protein [Ruminococcaceae bacterium OttesenSCG-928-A11]